VLVEELVQYRKAENVFDLLRASPLDLAPFMRRDPLTSASAGRGASLTVRVKGPEGRRHVPLSAAEVYLFLVAAGRVRETLRALTDENGVADFTFAGFYEPHTLIVMPYAGYWPKEVRGPRGTVDILCERLPDRGPGAWWHRAIGVEVDSDNGIDPDGNPVRVGVIDSGCGPHDALSEVIDGGAFIQGEYDPDGGDDSGAHGTHVCGIVAANAQGNRLPVYGIAPGVELHSVRVFPPDGLANQGDIADAIDHLLAADVQVINMSLGSSIGSTILQQAVENAYESGVLCVAAAGNDAGAVSYPAAHESVVAVGAIGQLGQVPSDALPALPTDPDLYGRDGFHAANFTNHGVELEVCAPGVGIIAPVPERHGHADPYVAMNGTSMASPVAVGALAILLSRDRAYRSMPPDMQRARYARNALLSTVRSIDLPRAFEGYGLINLRGMMS